jgi:preprotein translocase subunit SecE
MGFGGKVAPDRYQQSSERPLNFFQRIPVFIAEVKAELIKVSWPARKDLLGACVLVVTVTAALTLYIGVLDFVLSKAVSTVMK